MMTFSEFIERYKSMDETTIPAINFTKYITIGDKVSTAQELVDNMNELYGYDIQAPIFIKNREILKFFTLLGAYTDIVMEHGEETEENYDYCQEMGIEKLLISNIPIYEYRRFEKIIDDMLTVNDVLLLKNAMVNNERVDLAKEREALGGDIRDNADLIEKMFDIISPHTK